MLWVSGTGAAQAVADLGGIYMVLILQMHRMQELRDHGSFHLLKENLGSQAEAYHKEELVQRFSAEGTSTRAVGAELQLEP